MKQAFSVMAVMILLAGCGTSASSVPASAVPSSSADPSSQESTPVPSAETVNTQLHLTSSDLHDGVWDSIIASEGSGQNQSPELSWETVDGAEEYAVIMIDPDGNNWIHWEQTGIRQTSLERGQASSDQYIGPYPPSGTHHYEVHVYALAAPVDTVDASFNQGGNDLNAVYESLGGPDNVISQDEITGTYTSGD